MGKTDEKMESLVLNVWPDVGKALNLSKPTVYALVRQGTIPSIRFGRRIVVPKKALDELLSSVAKENPNA